MDYVFLLNTWRRDQGSDLTPSRYTGHYNKGLEGNVITGGEKDRKVRKVEGRGGTILGHCT